METFVYLYVFVAEDGDFVPCYPSHLREGKHLTTRFENKVYNRYRLKIPCSAELKGCGVTFDTPTIRAILRHFEDAGNAPWKSSEPEEAHTGQPDRP